MKTTLSIIIILLISYNSRAQSSSQNEQGITAIYELNNTLKPIVSGDSIYIPIRAEDNTYTIHIAGISDTIINRIYNPPKAVVKSENFAIEDGYIYYHKTGKIIKYDMRTNNTEWITTYDSDWGAQWEPVILGDYVATITDDKIMVLNKKDGSIKLAIKGKNFEDGISLSGDFLIITKWKGATIAYDLNTGKKLWSMDVGEQAGQGTTTADEKIFLTSWSPKFYCINRTTGKKIWTSNLKDYKPGADEGIDMPPLSINNMVYAPHVDYGLLIFDQSTGVLIKSIAIDEAIMDDIFQYKDYIVFSTANYFYVFSIKDSKVVKKVELPSEISNGINISGKYAVLGQGNKRDKKAIVVVLNLDKIIPNP